MNQWWVLLSVLVLVCGWMINGHFSAQTPDTCPVLVEEAVNALAQLCHDTERNQVCYGHLALEVEAQPNVIRFEFNSPGDIASVANIRSLRLQPLNETAAIWGVALMKLQANLPDTLPGQNVTVLLFGDVSMQTAETEDGAVSMEAFYFTSGIGDAACAEMPSSGVLIQSSADAGKTMLHINGVELEFGSTLYLQTDNDEHLLYIYVVEGEAIISAFDGEETLTPGNFLTVPLDENLNPAGPPSTPAPYDAELILPLNSLATALPETIAIGELAITDAQANPTTGACMVQTSTVVNLRQGPGTNFPLAGSLQSSESLVAVGQAKGLDTFKWWQLESGQWVREDVVQEIGDCVTLPIILELPPTPTPVPQASGGRTVQFDILRCRVHEAMPPLYAGDEVHFFHGRGDWASPEEADSMLAGHEVVIFIDGAQIPTSYYMTVSTPNGYAKGGWAIWTATAGTHTAYAEYTGIDTAGPCTFTVEP